MLPYQKVEAHRQELSSRHARHFKTDRRLDWAWLRQSVSAWMSKSYGIVRDLVRSRAPRQAV